MAQPAAKFHDLTDDRNRMVDRQIAGRGVRDPRVLEAMRQVPREMFIAPGLAGVRLRGHAAADRGGPDHLAAYIVALMIEAAQVKPGDRVLDIGTGSGYAAAALSRIAGRVYTVERHGALAETARQRGRAAAGI